MFKTIITAIFLAINLALQIAGLPKIVTGIIVNAIYIFLYHSCDLRHVFMLAILTPLLSFFTGHLPPPLMLMAPFIAAGNIAMTLCYHIMKDKNKAARAAVPAVVKAIAIAVPGVFAAGKLGLDNAALLTVHIVISIQFFTAVPGILLGEYLFSRLSPALGRYTGAVKEIQSAAARSK